jgi:hypothetical protein
MTFAGLADRLAAVREELAGIQAAHGLRHPVRIVAVTKGHAAAAVGAALAAGLADVGENRVQEALAKQDALPGAAVRWHLIGHVQTNKARRVVGRFALVHAVDSIRLIDALATACGAAGAALDLLIQVNVAGEEQKSGCPPTVAGDLVARAAAVPALRVRGLMTMAPFTDDEAVQRRTFGALRALRERLATPALPLEELSMGMSGDWRAAVAEGATLVRLGTILFGERA